MLAVCPKVLDLSSSVTCCLCNGTIGDRPISVCHRPEDVLSPSQLRVSPLPLLHGGVRLQVPHLAGFWGVSVLLGRTSQSRGLRAQQPVILLPQAALGSPHLWKYAS